MKGLSEIFQFSIKNGGEENWMKCPRLWLLPIFGKCHLWYGQVAQILYSSTTTLLSPDYNACTAQGNIRKISISRRKNFCYLFVIYNKWAEKEKGKGWSTKVFFIPSSWGSKHWLYILRSIKQLVFYHGNEWTAFCVLHSPFSKTGFNHSFRNCFDFLFIFSFKKGRNTLFSGTIFKKVK